MAVDSRVVTVADEATRLDNATGEFAYGAQGFAVHNDGDATIFIGGPEVTTANGFPLAAGQKLSADLAQGDAIYGIVATGTEDARVFETGVTIPD